MSSVTRHNIKLLLFVKDEGFRHGLLTAMGNASTQLNAISLRDISSTAWSGAVSGNLGGPDNNFNGGNNYATANGSNFLTFADTDGAGNAVANTTLTPVAGAITSGTLSFINSTTAYTLNGGIAGASIAVSGSGAVTLNGNNTINSLGINSSAAITVGGTLTASSIRFGSNSGNLSGTGTLAVPAGGLAISSNLGAAAGGITQTISLPITGSGPISIASMGDTSNSGGGNSSIFFINNGSNSFTGNITITSGLVDTGANDLPFGNAANTIILNGGGLLANANTTYANTRNIQLAGTGYFRTYGNTTFTIPGIISGTGPLVKTDGGTLQLNGQNTFTGGVQLPVGTISIGASSTPTTGTVTSGPLGTGSVTFNGGALTSSGLFTLANPLVFTGNSNVYAGTGGNLTVTGAITGAGTFQNSTTNSNTTFVTGDISGFTGTISYTDNNNGNNFGFTGTTAASQNAAGASLAVNGATTSTRSMAIGTASATTFQAGSLSGTGGIIGPGTNAATITLQVGALNTSPGAFAGVLSNTSGLSTGVLALSKVGTGTLLLTGSSTYTGPTTVSAGTLQVNGTLGATAVTVNGASAVLDGASGTIGGPISVVAGTLTPGTSTAIGKITDSSTNSTAALSFSSGGTYLWKLGSLTDNATGVAGTDFDQVALTGSGGNLQLGGTSNLTLAFLNSIADPNSADPFWQSNHSWTIIAGVPGNTSSGNSFSSITNNSWTDGTFSTAPGSNGSETLNFTTAAPEPATLSLLGLCGIGLLARRRRYAGVA
ncbi:MAG TPA: autotransporter-associated beta strand repeat-containing protein [Tepidisphaeraceae bacterium]|jgi:autotransporter-associated beta strand protein|nr:autotransporter-associated beta strand repeat-containing protein [Tepidisphaeraceae bacterium]